MSDKESGFVDRTIDEIQDTFFRRVLPKQNGRWRYRRTGLNAPAGTLVLFQFKARIIASALFVCDEKYARLRRGHAGEMRFEPESIRTFAPLDADAMRTIWPGFRAFGQVKQFLNPTCYSAFRKQVRLWK